MGNRRSDGVSAGDAVYACQGWLALQLCQFSVNLVFLAQRKHIDLEKKNPNYITFVMGKVQFLVL